MKLASIRTAEGISVSAVAPSLEGAREVLLERERKQLGPG
jgi:hypothetical protein